MINTQIKSHWRLAGRTVWKAIVVTLMVASSYVRAKYYIVKNSERLQRKRIDLDKEILQLGKEQLDKAAL
jgi:hypothetical protein